MVLGVGYLGLLYPLVVPATSIYYSAKLLLGGEDDEEWLTRMKGLKMLEHLGQYCHFSISKISVLISRRGRSTADTDGNIHRQQRRSH